MKRLLQFRVLRLGFFQDGDVGVGVFPEDEEVLVGTLRFGSVAGEDIRAGELQVGERAEQEVLHDSGVVEELLEFGGRSGTILLSEICQAAKVCGIDRAQEDPPQYLE